MFEYYCNLIENGDCAQLRHILYSDSDFFSECEQEFVGVCYRVCKKGGTNPQTVGNIISRNYVDFSQKHAEYFNNRWYDPVSTISTSVSYALVVFLLEKSYNGFNGVPCVNDPYAGLCHTENGIADLEAWNSVIRDILFAFSIREELSSYDDGYNEMMLSGSRHQRAEYYWYDHNDYTLEEMQDRYERGMKLFARYFGSLWD